ncbi:MAG TPA: KUP/HAK/KT family potassium transporter [Solirubrobacteraceae bacterium]|nr:KUP/HAK/KT family potassium transporter [Solirubrobacteraceae bacterium]
MSDPRPSRGVPVTKRPWELAAEPRPHAAIEPIEPGKEPDLIANAGRMVLALGALGVVFGDIGTSPLYTVQVLFTYHAARQVNDATVYGLISLVFWSLIIVVSVKYAGVIMRVHNRGEGGIMALAALCRRCKVPHALALVTLGIFGACLFFGDGVITPAISVLSAVSGLEIPAPGLAKFVVLISVLILIFLFAFQRKGTGTVGALFGPIMLLWFTVIGVLGLREVIAHPAVLQALSPMWGVRFFADHGVYAFLALGGVVLAVTGAEALYADRGHFGQGPIRLAWFSVAFPGVLLSYLGQAALILGHPADKRNPFFLLIPRWGQVPMVIFACAATVIASQAVISGSYSVARQAMQLGYLPRLRIVHTSKMEGQIYVPVVNWALMIGVIALVLAFQNSNRLANAYGVAVTGTFVLNTVLFLAVAKALWKTPRWRLVALGTLFLTVEAAFFAANLAKIFQGAWLPIVAGLTVMTVMMTWNKGRAYVTRVRASREGTLRDFIAGLDELKEPVRRVPGVAIYLNPNQDTTPLAFRAEIEHTHALHEKVLIVSVEAVSVPYVDDKDRFVIERLGDAELGIRHVNIRMGYQEETNVPAMLRLARRELLLERDLNLEGASYFVSRITLVATDEPTELHAWQKKLFVAIARNAASPIEAFDLPSDRTVAMGSSIEV